MKHKNHPKRIAHFKKRYKHLAAAFAGAMILSSALLPGIPIATAHAAANPNVGNTRTTTTRTASANRADSATGQNTNVNDMPDVTSRPNVTSQPSSSEKTPATPEAPKVNEEKTPTTPEAPKVNEEKTPTTPEAPKVNEDKIPTNPETPKVSEDKTPTGPSLPSEGGSTVNPVERSTNPNQDTVTATPKVNEDKTPTGPSLPSEGGSAVNPVEKSSNPNQDTVNTPLPKATPDSTKTSGDVPTDYKEVLNITATAYSPGPLDNDQWGDKTYMGTTIRPGVIAVDPKVIPLGSKVYVQYPDGHGEYAVAEDTGGAIKGNRIDIAMMDRGNAKDFGIQPVKVYVVDTPKKT